MRILHVIHRFPPAIGGSETWCAGLAAWQAARGDTVTVLTHRAVEEDDLWSPAPPRAHVAVGPDDVADAIRVRRAGIEPPSPTLVKVLGRLGLWAWTGALSPELAGLAFALARTSDVVHAHTVPLAHAFVAWAAARAARRPLVITPHFHVGDPGHEHRSIRWLLRHADRVLVMTAAEAEALVVRGVDRRRLVAVTNAISAVAPTAPAAEVRRALDVPIDAPLITFLGRKARTKGLDVLYAALPRLAVRPAPVLAIAGPATEWYRDHPAPPGPVRVVDVPPLSEAAKAALLGASDLLVLPSRHEAFGIVFLEAWAAGTAVVGADIPAVRDAVGDAGTLFRPDDAADLAARIDHALTHPDERARQVAAGRARLGTLHTWERVGTTVDETYRALVGHGAVAHGPET